MNLQLGWREIVTANLSLHSFAEQKLQNIQLIFLIDCEVSHRVGYKVRPLDVKASGLEGSDVRLRHKEGFNFLEKGGIPTYEKSSTCPTSSCTSTALRS